MRNLFLINTPYHFIVSYFFVKSIQRNIPDSDNVFVFLENDTNAIKPIFNKLVNKDNAIKCKIYFYNCTKLRPKTFILNKRKFEGFIKKHQLDKKFNNVFFYADHPAANILLLKHHINQSKLLMIEEGIGPYNPLNVKKVNFKRKIKQFIMKSLKYPNATQKPFGQVITPNIALVSEKDYVYSEFAKEAIILNLPKGPFINIYIEEILEILEVNDKELQEFKRKMLFLSQPLEEAGYGKDEKFIIELVKLMKKNIIEMVVKLHPAENEKRVLFYESLGCKVLKKQSHLPVDLLFSILQPKAVLTVMSSAALNYSLRENGKVIWLENIFLNSNTSRFKIIEDIGKIRKLKSFSELSNFLKEKDEHEEGNDFTIDLEEWDKFIKNLIS